jgi:hypothetical protein
MTSEDLQRKNASLRDKIEEVLEMHPELRDATEQIALRQDLHVAVGTPFLERTQDKLQERARAIIQRRPELADYFDGFTLDASGETKLTAALKANVALRVEAERLIAAYVAPESDRPTIVNELITLFDGPQQREAERLALEALAEDQGSA